MMKDINPIEGRICKCLRGRNPYGMTEGGENPWYLLDDANTVYWCILSAGAAGPDNNLVGPKWCVAGRSCFVAPEKKKAADGT